MIGRWLCSQGWHSWVFMRYDPMACSSKYKCGRDFCLKTAWSDMLAPPGRVRSRF